MKKFLVIQTAFIGDVVLATALLEKLHVYFPKAEISILVRKGNEGLFKQHPFINEVLIWNKKEAKIKNLLSLIKLVRAKKYDKVINIQRFFATGLITVCSGAKEKIGFNKNPLSFLFDKKIKHVFDTNHPKHEVEKNNELIAHFTDNKKNKPVLYPSAADYAKAEPFTNNRYITINPASVWFTKQYPPGKWMEFINTVSHTITIFLLGAADNFALCEKIASGSSHPSIIILAGKMNFLESAALMEKAEMNYVNDSAPLHFASARNAPVTAIFCSTTPAFGYFPLSDRSYTIETTENLPCKPCGIHGQKKCPQHHFRCAFTIQTQQLLHTLNTIK